MCCVPPRPRKARGDAPGARGPAAGPKRPKHRLQRPPGPFGGPDPRPPPFVCEGAIPRGRRALDGGVCPRVGEGGAPCGPPRPFWGWNSRRRGRFGRRPGPGTGLSPPILAPARPPPAETRRRVALSRREESKRKTQKFFTAPARCRRHLDRATSRWAGPGARPNAEANNRRDLDSLLLAPSHRGWSPRQDPRRGKGVAVVLALPRASNSWWRKRSSRGHLSRGG